MTVLLRFVVAIAAAMTIGFAGAGAAKAAPVSYGFQLVQDGGNIAGAGSFTIDDAVFTGVGSELFDPFSGLLDFDVSIGGIDFDIADDVAFPLFPQISFESGLLAGISYAGLVTVGESDSSLIISGLDFQFFDPTGAETLGSVRVPEPSALLVVAAGLGLIGGMARRTRRA